MAKLYNLARMTTATTGTGTITLGSAATSYLSFSSAGVQDGDVITYAIVDGNNREIGRGTYTASGTTLSRDTILDSTNAGSAINLSGAAEVFITAAGEDITSDVAITGGTITGITDLAVADGGTGVSSLAAYALVAGGTTSTGPVQSISGVGTSGQVLTSNGAASLPTWQDAAGGGGGVSFTSTQAFTTSGTYTPTSGTKSAVVFIQAGGGGGGGADNDFEGTGGGGGGCVVLYINETDFASIGTPSVTIGSGGAGGSVTGTSGGTGGNTSFGTLAVAEGGGGGQCKNTTGSATFGAGGGAVTAGTYTIYGQNGSLPSRTGNDTGGDGGRSYFGTNGIGGNVDFAAAGTSAVGYGGGGGGGATTGTTGAVGGDGGNGYVLVLEYS